MYIEMIKKKNLLLHIILFSLAFFVFFPLYGCSDTKREQEKRDNLLFADAGTVWWTAPTIIARTHDLYSEEGLSVRAFDVTTGLASKNAVISGNADIGLVASTPLAIAASKKEKIIVLGSYIESSSLLAVISRISEIKKNDLSHIKENLKRSLNVGYVPQTISEFYLLQFLKSRNIINIKNDFTKLALPPPSISIAFQKKDVNTVVIWEPFATQIVNPLKESAEEKLTVIRDPLYTLRLYLITRPDVWNKKRTAVEKFVKAVMRAGEEIEKNQPAIRKEIEHYFNYPDGWLEERWKDIDFSFKTDVETMKELILQDAQLAIESGILEKKPDIDYMLTEVPKIASMLEKK